jgi:hypothetical protein
VKPVTGLWFPVFVFCYVSLVPAQAQTDSGLLVTIDSGVIEGVPFGSAKDEVMFLGIPYAAPPIGERRWKPPQPLAKWQGWRLTSLWLARGFHLLAALPSFRRRAVPLRRCTAQPTSR